MNDWATVSAVVGVLLTGAQIAIVVIALFVLPGGRRPQTAMAWLILILALPFLGFALFLLLGRNTVGRKRRAEQAEVNAAILAAAPLAQIDSGTEADRDDHSPLVHGLAHLNRTLGVLPFTTGNSVELTDDYAGCVEAMRQEIATATDYVHVQFYISAWDEVTAPVFEELVRATQRGVTVRFLFDHLGSKGIPGYKDFVAKLDATSIQWTPMLPIRPLKGELRRPDLRNHRKMLVVDGRVAYSG